MVGPDLRAPLGSVWWRDLAGQLGGSGFGVAVQVLCPVLVALGLLTRPAAFALLVQVLILPPAAMSAGQPVPWAALAAWLTIDGPGRFSVDTLVGSGISTSAIPGPAVLAAWYDRLRRRGSPAARLVLRLSFATVLAAAARPGLTPDWLPAVPGMTAMLPALVTMLLAACLAAGFAVRPAALVVILLVPVSQIAGVADTRLTWVLLAAILLVHGGGLLSLDGLLAIWPVPARPVGAARHVVIVGGGFGGIAVARGLRDAACRVTLIDRVNHHLFQPLLYQVATAGLSPADIATPIRAMLRDQPNARVLLGEVTGVDTAGGAVLLEGARLEFDTLVLATGARHAYFGRPDWERFAPGLKSIEDATDIRRRLLLAFERAEDETDLAARAAWLTFVVVGGGPTGVELAGAIAELARQGLTGEFRTIDPASARVLLLQSAPRLLPAFSEASSETAAASLRRLGVEVRLGCRVTGIGADAVTVGDQVLPARTVLWAAGVMASPAARWLGVVPDAAGRVAVAADLTVAGSPDVFVIGDTAAVAGWHGQAVPGLAPAAKQAGAYVAGVIRRRLEGRRPPGPFRYRHMGNLATIGRKSAVAEFGRVRVRGALAWWLWGAAHIAFLIGGRNRMTVLVEWMWAYLTLRRGTRLITGPR